MFEAIFWSVMALTYIWYMWDGGAQAVEEWVWQRQARKEIKKMNVYTGNPGQGKEAGRYED